MDAPQKQSSVAQPQPQIAGQEVVSPVSVQQSSTPVIQQPIGSDLIGVGGVNKEMGPVARVEAPVAEYLAPSESEPTLDNEVAEAGVEKVPSVEQPKLTIEDKRAGLDHAKAAVPVAQAPTGAVILPNAPMTEAEAVMVEKTTKFDDSKHWLAALVLEQFKRARELLRSKK